MKYDVVVKQETENKYYRTLAMPELTILEPFAEKFLSAAIMDLKRSYVKQLIRGNM